MAELVSVPSSFLLWFLIYQQSIYHFQNQSIPIPHTANLNRCESAVKQCSAICIPISMTFFRRNIIVLCKGLSNHMVVCLTALLVKIIPHYFKFIIAALRHTVFFTAYQFTECFLLIANIINAYTGRYFCREGFYYEQKRISKFWRTHSKSFDFCEWEFYIVCHHILRWGCIKFC